MILSYIIFISELRKITNFLSFYPPKSCFKIIIQFLESKFSFSGDISPFYVMIYNSKTWSGFLNTDLDICRVHSIYVFWSKWPKNEKKSVVIFRQIADFLYKKKKTGQLIFSCLVTLTKKRKTKNGLNQTYKLNLEFWNKIWADRNLEH
jgi:hypothetical protein